jgi:hypothetical protein
MPATSGSMTWRPAPPIVVIWFPIVIRQRGVGRYRLQRPPPGLETIPLKVAHDEFSDAKLRRDGECWASSK